MVDVIGGGPVPPIFRGAWPSRKGARGADKARVSNYYEEGYLKPWKRILVDVYVSKEALERALEMANTLFLALERRGHSVTMAPTGSRYPRADLSIWEEGKRPSHRGEVSWRGPDSQEYPHFTGGTSFLVRRVGRLWLVTAKHALQDKSLENLCVPWNLDTHDVLPLERVFLPTSKDLEDNAFTDLAVFAVAPTRQPPKHVALNLETVDWVKRFADVRAGDDVLFAGFPRESLDNDVDYDAHRISRQRFLAQAKYVEPAESKHLHRVQVTQMGKVTTLQGMSGSPVFLRPQTRPSGWSFAGVLLRGSDAGLAHFVEAGIVLASIRMMMRKEPLTKRGVQRRG